MWPFSRKKQAPQQRFVPMPPYVDGERWASIGTVSSISPRAAQNLAAVLGAVNSIACTIASLPAYVTTSDDSREEVPDHPLQRLIERGVNDDEAWNDFVEGLLASTLLTGNALAEIETDQRGRLTGLKTIPWPQVVPWVDEAGILLFDYIPTLPPNAGKKRRLLKADTLYLKDRSDNGVIGVSRLTRAAGALQIASDLQNQSSMFLRNASRPGGTLSPSVNIGDEQRRKLKEEWDIAFRSGEYGKVAILPMGSTYAPLSMLSSQDAELVNHRNFSVSDVCRIYSVPPWLLADPIRATFASASAAMKTFTMTSILPWTRKIEAAFAQSVLGSGYLLHFDVDSLIKSDIAELYSSLLKGRQGGWLSSNDCRKETGFDEVPDGDNIEPPVAGGVPADATPSDTPAPPPEPDDNAPDDGKIAPFNPRARHGGD